MIVTEAVFASHRVALIANGHAQDTPRLMEVNWLQAGDSWHSSKSIAKLKKHHGLCDKDFSFIAKNSLSKNKPAQALLIETITQLTAYFSGARQTFDLPLDMSLGTEFQQRVWQALQGIDYGEAISYAELAKRVGSPKGFRAVANANGKNPFSIIVPCHRVIASDGKIGGYTGGLDKKAHLLVLEKINYKR
ncbi:methylated-DNA--[protein]-cysteine S-methyltransferase [uncultured Psychrobacter sp.]|uniref:methylated-DNA--[protein]-cysteine S-methyltransferase n=1 Tax=uncultured Psychrobacter sp. TaxID=259303 RepID=UPI002594922D|nr:methylated-DNA--[protein]-cysteine S-methyltransferase [uncultured Psychrobacter sp.]